MSAKPAPNTAPAPDRRQNRRAALPISFTAALGAAGLGLLLAAGSASDITDLSDAMGVPIETVTLPAHG